MKKILMFAIYGAHLLPSFPINAAELLKKPIIVPNEYQIDNGLMGLERDIAIQLMREITQNSQLNDAEKKIRNIIGISQDTLHWIKHKNFLCMVPPVLKFKHLLEQPLITKKILGELDSLRSVASDGMHIFVATGAFYRNNIVISSNNDGETWNLTKVFNENTRWSEVMYADGKFIVSYSKYVYVSKDGVNWQQVLDSDGIISVTYGNDKFVAVAENGDVFSSIDGYEWTPPVKAFPTLHENPFDRHRVAYANGIFVFAYKSSSTMKFFTSEDGVTWPSEQQKQINIDGYFNGLSNSNKMFILHVGNEFFAGHNGVDWTSLKPPEASGKRLDVIRYIAYNELYNGHVFMAPMSAYPEVLLGFPTLNGIRWSSVKLQVSVNIESITDVAFANGKIILLGRMNNGKPFIAMCVQERLELCHSSQLRQKNLDHQCCLGRNLAGMGRYVISPVRHFQSSSSIFLSQESSSVTYSIANDRPLAFFS
ncbi:MAG: hypothetical protein LBT90_01310 [Holosporaceae bacterium]|jgi:hypothetical protein|nr:hypothetical protein [Holosporaceae bacterium]